MKYFIYILLLTLGMTSCLEVLELNHGKSDPVLIVDALITDQPGPHTIKLTRTIDFSSDESSQMVSDAIVTIADNLGNSEELVYTEEGIYQTNNTQGVVGRTYSLNIEYNGRTYTSESTLLPVSEIDPLISDFQFETSLSDEGYYVTMRAKVSVPDVINYYRWRIFENDSLYNDIEDLIVADDEYSDDEFEFQFGYPFEIGDEVRVEMSSISKEGLNYYEGFYEVITNDGGLFSPPPVNAPSNISNGALGLFQASAVVTKSIVIEE